MFHVCRCLLCTFYWKLLESCIALSSSSADNSTAYIVMYSNYEQQITSFLSYLNSPRNWNATETVSKLFQNCCEKNRFVSVLFHFHFSCAEQFHNCVMSTLRWQVFPVETTYELARTRVRTNAQRINRFELPLYGDLVDARAKRLRLLLDLYGEVQRSTHARRDAEYCAWRRLLSPGETCRCTTPRTPSLTFSGCVLPPVAPHLLPRSASIYIRLRVDLN